MKKVKLKPQMQDVKLLDKSNIPKTSGDLMKIKVQKAMSKEVQTRSRSLVDENKIRVEASDGKVISVAELKSKNQVMKQTLIPTKIKADAEKAKSQKSTPKNVDFSSAYKTKFRKTKLLARKTAKTAKKTVEVASSAMASAATVAEMQKNQSMQETSLQMQNAVTNKMKNFAKHKTIKKAQKLAQDGAKKTAVQTAKVAYKSAKFIAQKIATAMVKLARVAYASLGGGLFFVSFIAMFAILAVIIASPFGIFYSGQDSSNPDVVPISAVVGQLNADFGLQMEAIQDSVPHDSVTIDGEEADVCDVLAVFAVKANEDNDVVTINQARVEQIKQVFWDMNSLTYDTEVAQFTDENGNLQTGTILHIHINHKTADDMRVEYSFNDQQNEALDGMLQYRSMLLSLMGNLDEIQGDAQQLINAMPDNITDIQRKIVETACSLVGKVNYFWGGKYSQIGWNPEWGSIKQVTAAGSPTTGTMRVYGLDCSGFVSWVFINASGNLGSDSIIGEGTKSQWANATQISWSDAQIGDLTFYPDLSHVGIVVGVDQNGNVSIANCASGANNVVITGKSGFTIIARPSFSMFNSM